MDRGPARVDLRLRPGFDAPAIACGKIAAVRDTGSAGRVAASNHTGVAACRDNAATSHMRAVGADAQLEIVCGAHVTARYANTVRDRNAVGSIPDGQPAAKADIAHAPFRASDACRCVVARLGIGVVPAHVDLRVGPVGR